MSKTAETTKGVRLGEPLQEFRSGKPIQFSEETDSDGKAIQKDLTLADAIIVALFNGIRREPPESATDQARRFRIANRVQDADIIAFTAEETTLIMDSAARYWGPLVIGRMYEKLDPAVLDKI